MDSIYQRLKELDPDTFQKLCFHLLVERYPDAGVRSVGSGAGDEGLDQFAGELGNGPSIWQCKSFPNGVGKSQKQQIQKSLKRALDRCSPKQWVLCLSTDMDSIAHRWFQKLQKKHQGSVDIGLWQGSEIAHEVMHHRTIRDHFFPSVAIDPIELKRLVMKTGELTSDELGAITHANAEDLIERFKERDGRFNYELVFNTEAGPPWWTARPGIILSMADDKKTVNVYARDREALEADPPEISLTIKGSGVEKFMSAMKRGIAQELLASELEGITTTFGFVDPPQITPGLKLLLMPHAPTKTLKLRLRFCGGEEVIEYPLIEFGVARAGTDEAEFVSTSTLPFKLSFVVPFAEQPPTSWSFTTHLVGRKVGEVRKFLRVLSLMRSEATVSLYDLESEQQILSGRLSTDSMATEPDRKFEEFLKDLSVIEARFNVEFTVPENVSDDDRKTLLFVKAYMRGESVPLNNIGFKLVKSEQNKDTVPTLLANPRDLCLRYPNPTAVLFGATINIGPAMLIAETAHVVDLQATLQQFEAADVGEAVQIIFEPESPVKFTMATA